MKRHQTTISNFFRKFPRILEENVYPERRENPAEIEIQNEVVETVNQVEDDEDIETYQRPMNSNEILDALSKIKNPPPDYIYPGVQRGNRILKFSYHWLG